jgi:hypothetical protein
MERGQTTVEWLGAMLLVVALVALVRPAAPVVAGHIADAGQCVIDQVQGTGCGAAEEARRAAAPPQRQRRAAPAPRRRFATARAAAARPAKARAAAVPALYPIVVACFKVCPKARDGIRKVVRLRRKPKVRKQQVDPRWKAAAGSGASAKLRSSLTHPRAFRPDDPRLATRKGWEAHHIVAVGSPKAAPAQRIMLKCGQDPNASVNGVFLPKSREAVARSRRQPHSDTFTDVYYRNVNTALSSAHRNGGCKAVIATLDTIRYHLVRGTFAVR